MNERAYIGCLLGTAVGDSLGLPYEGLSPRRGSRMFTDNGCHHLLFGKGMVSDDTEHACFAAQALVNARGDVDEFGSQLARSLRWWLLGLPAGVGYATLRSILKLWIGFAPDRSGVFSSGNGPAMRSPIIGVALGHSDEDLRSFVLRSTRITHSDPKAFYGALAVALAAYQSASEASVSPASFLNRLEALLADEPATDLLNLLRSAAESAAKGEPVSAFAAAIGSSHGISGYMYHTVPCVIQVWLRHADDFEGGLREMISAGGDTDTTGAILGAILGARVGKEGIPPDWLRDIIEWPRSVAWMERLGSAVAETFTGGGRLSHCPDYFVPGVVVRNILFLLVVILHGLRRLAPPY
ncbi:MAG TPA: ADP-ribosylglycohydrolase family protein [Gallionella sp.]|nr:ADP-ribosylglycohydrolase family protein [Gallionella sp.]